MFKFVVCKSVDLLPGGTNDNIRERSRQFWLQRRIKFQQNDEFMMVGKRGNIWANWTSFEQDQILATLTLLFVEAESVSARIEVNTVGQCMTDWTKAYFFLEMRTFASMLLQQGDLEEEWDYFKKGRSRAAILWCASGMILGNRMPLKEQRFFLSVDDSITFAESVTQSKSIGGRF